MMKKLLILLSIICIIILVMQIPSIILSPKITKGEFPFKLVYELNGETHSIEDIIVCKYNGIDYITSAGINLKWNTYLKSKNKMQDEESARIVLLDVSKENIFDDFGNQILEFYFYGGNATYYLDAYPSHAAREAQEMDYISYRYKRSNNAVGHSIIEADVAYEKYKLRLISWECAPPVK